MRYWNCSFDFYRKPITITAERLSDNSRITFTISSDKTIEQLRALLNHHLPPLSPGKFDLYSYQRGALIHFHPSSFKLDYFPVIFDQSVLLLKMDDRSTTNVESTSPKLTRKDRRKTSTKEQYHVFNDCLSSKSARSRSNSREQSPPSTSKITCLTLLKQIFHLSSSTSVNTDGETNILAYWMRSEETSGDNRWCLLRIYYTFFLMYYAFLLCWFGSFFFIQWKKKSLYEHVHRCVCVCRIW